MASATKYYKLGAKASNFWDPTQPELDNQKLSLGQVKPLTSTKRVNVRLRAGGLVLAEKEEYEEYMKSVDASKKKGAIAESKGLKAAKKQVEKAHLAKEEAEKVVIKLELEKDELAEDNLNKSAALAEANAKLSVYDAGGTKEEADKAVADSKEDGGDSGDDGKGKDEDPDKKTKK